MAFIHSPVEPAGRTSRRLSALFDKCVPVSVLSLTVRQWGWLHDSTAADDLSKTIGRFFAPFFRLFQPFSPFFAVFPGFSAVCADLLRFSLGVYRSRCAPILRAVS